MVATHNATGGLTTQRAASTSSRTTLWRSRRRSLLEQNGAGSKTRKATISAGEARVRAYIRLGHGDVTSVFSQGALTGSSVPERYGWAGGTDLPTECLNGGRLRIPSKAQHRLTDSQRGFEENEKRTRLSMGKFGSPRSHVPAEVPVDGGDRSCTQPRTCRLRLANQSG